MTILQPGNINWYKDKAPYQFHCRRCGCVWIGFEGEYDAIWDEESGIFTNLMECPTCKTTSVGLRYKEYKYET